MTTPTPLLPCPFCGDAPEIKARADKHSPTNEITFIACFCGGYSSCAHKYGHTEAEAIAAWNNRAQPAAIGGAGEATADQCIDLAAALEVQRAVKITESVAALEIGQGTSAFASGYSLACEEIKHRLENEQWVLGDGAYLPVAAPKSGDMAQGVPETDCGDMAQGEQGRDTWKTDGGWRCVKCHKGIMEHEDQTFCKRPAASTGAGQIAILEAAYDAVKKLAAHKQAKIDSLMLEYCPDEMTAEQTAEWAKHQKPAAAQPKGDG